jgi:hypothetical protein
MKAEALTAEDAEDAEGNEDQIEAERAQRWRSALLALNSLPTRGGGQVGEERGRG